MQPTSWAQKRRPSLRSAASDLMPRSPSLQLQQRTWQDFAELSLVEIVPGVTGSGLSTTKFPHQTRNSMQLSR